jgi:uncharacterized protein (TIGR00369 family)
VALQIPPNCDLTLGLVCLDKSTPGTTVWTMLADERFLNPAAMLDSAMGASVVTGAGARKVSVLNTEMKVSFLRPATLHSRLTCTATVLKSGSVISFVGARIVDDQDQLIATASSTYLIKEREG